MATMTDEEIKDPCARERARCQAEQPVDVDAVAKALAEEDTIASWDGITSQHKELWRKTARVAIAAMGKQPARDVRILREQAGSACEAKARSSRQVPQRGGGTMSAQSARPTPGPYTIRERSGGVEVRGAHGVSVAWFYESCTVGTDGSHSISTDEARANAEAFVAALENGVGEAGR